VTLQLCRLYHCTPLELDRQPLDVVLAHIACVEAEAGHQKREAALAKARGNRRRR
jgi:hypothetical protein